MKIRNKVIICLAIIGVVLYGVIEFRVVPENNLKEQQYLAQQKEPETHDLSRVLKYKNKYMGNASNIMNLFSNLPLSDVGMVFRLFPEKLTLEVNYKDTAWNIGQDRVDKALIYNSTAAFALIDNLEAIDYNFTGSAYKVSRADFIKWYGEELADLLQKDKWKAKVQDKINDNRYVKSCIKAITKASK